MLEPVIPITDEWHLIRRQAFYHAPVFLFSRALLVVISATEDKALASV